MTKCSERIRQLIIDGDLTQPLLTGCTRADVAAVLGSGGTDGEGRLSGRWRTWIKYPEANRHGKIRVWFGADGNALMFVVHDAHIKGTVDALLTRLGTPEDDLPTRTFRMNLSIDDHVYASKGTTLSVGKPLEGVGSAVVVDAYYYVPTTAKAYISNLGGKDQWVRKFRRR